VTRNNSSATGPGWKALHCIATADTLRMYATMMAMVVAVVMINMAMASWTGFRLVYLPGFI
jgi:hypothetical protein